jgi:stage II sporulation protein M
MLAAAAVLVAGAAPWLFAIDAELLTRREVQGSIRVPESPALVAVAARNLAIGALAVAGRRCWGATAIIVLLVNGYALAGSVIRALARGLPPEFVAAALVPHGLLELPALWIAGAAGLSGLPWLRVRLVPEGRDRPLRWWGISAALSLAAALIECTLTPAVIARVLTGLR